MEKLRKLKGLSCLCLIVSILLIACGDNTETQSELLSNLDVENASDFAALSPCRQIEIFAILGSEYTDVDHMTVIVPEWIHEVIDKHPPEVVGDCIVNEANKLLSQWGESHNRDREISYSIHALLYKADELDINKYPELERLFNRVVCHEEIFDDGQLILIYYTAKFGIADFPSREEMRAALCE
jgi:hypothetical protein